MVLESSTSNRLVVFYPPLVSSQSYLVIGDGEIETDYNAYLLVESLTADILTSVALGVIRGTPEKM